MRNGLTVSFSAAMLVVTLAPRRHGGDFRVQTAWLAQRESALGDWESVRPPLREGDELQLTLLTSHDAVVQVLDQDGRAILPASHVRAHSSYALPGPHQTWRLDGAAHDRLYLVTSRHPLAEPARALSRITTPTEAPGQSLPLRDGRPGHAVTRVLSSDEVVVDAFDAR